MTKCDCSEKKRLCTLRPSPNDPRDYSFEGLRPRLFSMGGGDDEAQPPRKLPETLDLRPYMNKVRDQGSRGTCAAFSAAAAKEYQEHIDNTRFKEYFSPDSIYLQRENADSEGMYGRDVMRILQHGGACREELFPYQGVEEPEGIPEPAKEEMPHYRIKKYAQVHTIEGAKRALLEYGPLLICLPFYDNGLAEFWRAPSIDAEDDGGHAVTVVGYDKKGFILRNSWGPLWNVDGHVLFPYEDFGTQWEIWSMVDEETQYLPPHLNPDSDDFDPLHDRSNWIKVLCGCCGSSSGRNN